MRALIATLAAAALLAGCQSASGSKGGTPGNNTFKYGTGDGQTMATAVEIRTHSEYDGGVMIKEWIRSRYPGYTIQEQELVESRERAYNMITIISPGNTAHTVFFDITQYYRRIDRTGMPQPIS